MEADFGSAPQARKRGAEAAVSTLCLQTHHTSAVAEEDGEWRPTSAARRRRTSVARRPPSLRSVFRFTPQARWRRRMVSGGRLRQRAAGAQA